MSCSGSGAAASVVIPTRNRRYELERAIQSVFSQSLTEWELIVVDDASTDGTAAFLDGFKDPRLRAVRLEEHAERSAARNHGLELVSSPAVLFLDDDDELLPLALESLSLALERNPAVCASVGDVIHEVDGMRRRRSFPKRVRTVDVRLELLAGWVALGGQSLFRTAVVRQTGGWRPGLSVAEDQELWLRVSGHGPVAILPDPVLLHRPHGLAGDAVDGRDVERWIVSAYLRSAARSDWRARRSAEAREHLRDADIDFQLSRYRSALVATVKGIITAPFLLASPLIGPGIARGLLNAVVASVLPNSVSNRVRTFIRRKRDASHSVTSR